MLKFEIGDHYNLYLTGVPWVPVVHQDIHWAMTMLICNKNAVMRNSYSVMFVFDHVGITHFMRLNTNTTKHDHY